MSLCLSLILANCDLSFVNSQTHTTGLSQVCICSFIANQREVGEGNFVCLSLFLSLSLLLSITHTASERAEQKQREFTLLWLELLRKLSRRTWSESEKERKTQTQREKLNYPRLTPTGGEVKGEMQISLPWLLLLLFVCAG